MIDVRYLVVLAVFSISLFSGCQARSQSRDTEQSNLKPLAILYGQFVGQHRGKPPADEQQFKDFVRSLAPERLASLGVADAESLFISARDKQPYVIVYGEPTGPPGPAGGPVIAYEQTGAGGTRYVASALGSVEQVDETRFRELVPDAN